MGHHEQKVYAIRHGETEWSLSGKHTGITDLPLTSNGRRNATRLRPVLQKESFALVLSSPLQRALETCKLAGFESLAQVDRDLMEWNYGEYEGLTSDEIEQKAPGWMIFEDGCPGGENPTQVGARADRVIDRVRATGRDVALFAHGHVLRVLVARWAGLPASAGQHFLLDTGTVNILSYYRNVPAIEKWNAPLP
ncbi:MAG: histidine phosphatase family protein [Candidatus Binatia bacterium]